MAESLRAELLSIEGIAAAELEGSDDAPQGVRVQLAAGADAESVGREVQRVLATHGMRSHTAPADDADTSPAEEEPGERSGPPPPPGADRDGASILPIHGVSVETADAGEPATPDLHLDSVAVEEGRSGISVRVAAGARFATRQLSSGGAGLDAAIVGAVAEILGLETQAATVQRADTEDAKIVTVLADVVGAGRQVGSAVVEAGEAYAVAQAAWRALTMQE